MSQRGGQRPSLRQWGFTTLLVFVVVIAPALVAVQGTPRADAWPWLLLLGAGASVIVASVPVALGAWASRFPAKAERAEAIASGPWWWLAWLLATALVIALGGRVQVVSLLVLGVLVAVVAWRTRGNPADES